MFGSAHRTYGVDSAPGGRPQAAWRKSSYSAHNGNCVEFAEFAGGWCGVRDSKDPAGPVLVFSRQEWSAFVNALRAGEPGSA